MSRKRAITNHLSFLDVFTCGLGAVLLLLFAAIALNRHLNFNGDPVAAPMPAEGELAAPFVILLTSEEDFSRDAPPEWTFSKHSRHKLDLATHGRDYAFLGLAVKPALDERILFGPLPADEAGKLQVRVFRDGEAIWKDSPQSGSAFYRNDDGNLQLWPAL